MDQGDTSTTDRDGRVEVLPYSRPTRRFGLTKKQRRIFIFAGGMLAMVIVADLSIGRLVGREGCTTCGADSAVRYLHVNGRRWWVERQVRQGPLSKLIEKDSGGPCNHTWVYRFGDQFSLLGRPGARELGGGHSYGRADMMFHGDYPVEEVLEAEKARDEAFVAKLKHAIQNPDEELSYRFFDDLWERVSAYEKLHPNWAEARGRDGAGESPK